MTFRIQYELNQLESARLLLEVGTDPSVVAKKQLPNLIATLNGHFEMAEPSMYVISKGYSRSIR
jgi:hypothetical protein